MTVAPVIPFPGSSLVEHAVDYANAGLEIFPVNPRDKTPFVSQYEATTDENMLRAWWTQHPDALIGHRLPDEHIILDIDPRHGGHDVFAALKAEVGAFPMTRCHLSGRGDGGGHIWAQRPADKVSTTKLDAWAEQHGLGHEIVDKTGRRIRWTAGIDILQHNHRYTILPPSPHPDTGKPYQWANSPDTTVAALPLLLVDILTNDTPPEPPRPPRAPDPESIADWFSDTHTWSSILASHGWTIVGGDGDSDRSRWRHPTATSAFSATIRHSLLFVYSTSTAFEVTAPNDPHGYTPFRAWALLEHGGDLKAAGREARRLKGGNQRDDDWSFVGDNPPDPIVMPMPDDFWDARPQLDHIRQAAHARQRSADAVLHVVLARLCAITPHTYEIPAIVGAVAPLCYFAAVIAPAGIGKSTANTIGAELLPAPDWVADQLPLGSGEGLAELLFEMVEETDENGKKQTVKKQTRHNVFLYADEGQILGEIGNRKGATLLPTLRTIWTGGTLGQANSNRERFRVVPARTYTYGLVVGFQSAKAGALLEDVDGGTPQRFGWASALDPTIPDQLPTWPGRLQWQPPAHIAGGTPLQLPADIVTEVRAADLAQVRGQIAVDPLDTHARLYRLKVAGLLAILDGRRDVNLDDWALAGTIQDASNTIRGHVVDTVNHEAQRRQETSQRLHANREVAADRAKEQRRIVDCARKIKARVVAAPDEWTRIDLYRAMRRQRDVFDDALDHAIAEGWVIEKVTPSHTGDNRRGLHPGGDRV